MRLGAQFQELVRDLRLELNQSAELSHGIDNADRLKRAINSAYIGLYDDFDWPHLRSVTFDRVQMAAGQRFYDFPVGLDFERIENVRVWWNDQPANLTRGIGTAEYAIYDSDGSERSDPPLRWDIRHYQNPTPKTMWEVWPIPASTQASVEFTGPVAIREMVNDEDICHLDAEAVILIAALDIVPKEKRDAAISKATRRLSQIRARFPEGERVRLGLGRADKTPVGRAVVRISR